MICTPDMVEKATAYVELLDKLGIDKVYLLATSAGGHLLKGYGEEIKKSVLEFTNK